MENVFSLFEESNAQDWTDRGGAYGPTEIEKIANPDGDYSTKAPTSIPSPFARIDLFNTAFKFVASKSLQGKTIYHKLVSDSLDIGEILFNFDSLGDRIQIRSWDKYTDLQLLLNSVNPKHKLYGETLALFLQQDAKNYNFDTLNKIFFVLCDHQVIGGTSPSTLFFTSANNLSFTKIKFDSSLLFDVQYKQLYQRHPSFIKYLYKFFYANPTLNTKMPAISEYLRVNLTELYNYNQALHNELNELTISQANPNKELDSEYDALNTGIAGDNVEVLGCRLRKKKISNRGDVIQEQSDFVIGSSKYNKGYKPLVLQSNFSTKLKYTDENVLWDYTTDVPIYDPESDLNKRIVPGQLDKYPYLTVADFLQPNIIRLHYPIDNGKFFNGNITFENGNPDKHYLLPLTSRFFDFFDTDDLLKKTMYDGKKMIEMRVYAGSVEVDLRIPIKANGHYTTFSRTYKNNNNNLTNEIYPKDGLILENAFGLTLYPFLKTGDDSNCHYRVMMIERDILDHNSHFDYKLKFFKNKDNELLSYKSKKRRSTKLVETATSDFYVLEKEFEYIEVNHNEASGIIIPIFPVIKNGTDEFAFAVDFGTTNTHIEFTREYSSREPRSRTVQAFEITDQDIQIATLHDSKVQEEAASESGFYHFYGFIPQEFLPANLGQQFNYKFPHRTTLAYHQSLDTNGPTYSLADFNIPFIYEKETIYRGTKVKTNLKWSNYTLNSDEEKKIEAYFEQLILMIRNKVLLNNGKLENTKLFWFYPTSMIEDRRNKLERIWNQLFEKYISKSNKPKPISESIAPFYYFKSRQGIDASDLPVASIDIGGGTTDVVIYKENQPQSLTSFRFAANSIFGDAYNGSPNINGFVRKYEPEIGKRLENQSNELKSVLENIVKEQNSEDIVAFFFSLEKNKSLTDKDIDISFNKMLSDDPHLKIIFIISYASIIYHLAKLMKAQGFEIPRYLIFSGTGSKILSIPDSNTGLNGLNRFTNIVFQKVYGVQKSNIEIKRSNEPKELTCKGGLYSDKDINIEQIKSVLLGDQSENLVASNENPTISNGIQVNYMQVDQNGLLDNVVNEVKHFIDFVFDINKEFSFTDKFGVDAHALAKSKEILKEDLMQYLKSGIEQKRRDLNGKTDINLEETLFFYPLVGAINKLANSIAIPQN